MKVVATLARLLPVMKSMPLTMKMFSMSGLPDGAPQLLGGAPVRCPRGAVGQL
jgi:hypothetical protein